jgi:hypothetical protein
MSERSELQHHSKLRREASERTATQWRLRHSRERSELL